MSKSNYTGVLLVRTLAQRVLWEMELVGQLSDGHWENATPRDHWKAWASAAVDVAADPAHVGSYGVYARRDRYAFDDPKLLEIIGKRMIAFVRLATAYGIAKARVYAQLLNIDGDWRGMPEFPGKYWDDVRATLQGVRLDAVRAVVQSEQFYTKKHLVADLRDLKAIVRVCLPASNYLPQRVA